MTAGTPELFDRSVLVVSGKGGVGKTSVAAACAHVAATTRSRVVLAEIEGRDGIARLLGIPSPGFEERRTRFGHSVISISGRDALLEYLWLFFKMRSLARSLGRAKVVEVATEVFTRPPEPAVVNPANPYVPRPATIFDFAGNGLDSGYGKIGGLPAAVAGKSAW